MVLRHSGVPSEFTNFVLEGFCPESFVLGGLSGGICPGGGVVQFFFLIPALQQSSDTVTRVILH